MKNIGTISIGVKAPIVIEGDNIKNIVIDSIKNSEIEIEDKDIICIKHPASADAG